MAIDYFDMVSSIPTEGVRANDVRSVLTICDEASGQIPLDYTDIRLLNQQRDNYDWGQYYVSRVAGKVVGAVHFDLLEHGRDRFGRIAQIGVRPDFRGARIATTLLDAALNDLRIQKCSLVTA